MSLSSERGLKLLNAAHYLHEVGTVESGELGFTARLLAQTTLPHSNPGDVTVYERSNGAVRLYVQPHPQMGVPYGAYPRLLLAWITTEAVRTKKRRLVLGENLSGFMRQLGLIPSGGRWGTITRLRDQIERLLSARIIANYEGPGNSGMRQMHVADGYDLWWEPRQPDQASLWQSSIVLSEGFYAEIVRHPVPLDMRVLRAIKQSPLALDLYTWLTYRVSRLDKPLALSWAQLHEQFGADYAEPKGFAREARKHLRRLRLLWPEFRYETPRGRLIILPGSPHVPRLEENE